MRVLFLDQFSDMGGAQRGLLELMPAVEREGGEPHFALPGDGLLVHLLRRRGICVHPLSVGTYSLGRKGLADGIRFLADLVVVTSEIRDLVRRLEPSVVYVNGPRLMPAVARVRVSVPVIFHTHSHVGLRNGKGLVSAALRSTNATILAATRSAALQWKRPARVIHGGVDGPPPGFRRIPGKAGPRVGLIGRFHPGKCQKEFVEAAAELAADWPDIEFLLCGDAVFGDRTSERYKREVLAGAPPSVRFLGWREDVYEVLAALDLLVVPSRTEGGLPFVMLDAFAAGVPVLASPAGDIGEVIDDGQNGFLLRETKAPEIARQLRRLLRRKDQLAAAADRARRLWLERFTAERYRIEVWSAITFALAHH